MSLLISYNYINQFREIARENRVPYLILIIPTTPVVNRGFYNLPKQFKKDKINFLDTSYLSNEMTLDQFQASKFDAHPSIIVHNFQLSEGMRKNSQSVIWSSHFLSEYYYLNFFLKMLILPLKTWLSCNLFPIKYYAIK